MQPSPPALPGDTCRLRLVETDGNAYQRERKQWDSGADLVCASPGVVFAYDRNMYTNTHLRKQGMRVATTSSAPSRAAGAVAATA